MKECHKCHKIKELKDFYKKSVNKDKLSNICKQCDYITAELRREKLKSKVLCVSCQQPTNGIYFRCDKCKSKYNPYRIGGEYLESRRKHIAEVSKIYRQQPHVKNKINIGIKNRYNTSTNFRTSNKLRSRLRSAISDGQKNGSAIADLGCSIDYLLSYLANNYSQEINNETQIDHIVPAYLLNFANRQHVLLFCNYRNLRYLSKNDNIKRDYTDILDIINPDFINEFIPMFPESVPVLTKDDILISSTEYECEDGRKTILGWLKETFLYHYIDKDCFRIDVEDRKIFQIVLDKFRKCSKIGAKDDLHQWEESQTPTTQARAFNKLCRSLGYTTIVEE